MDFLTTLTPELVINAVQTVSGCAQTACQIKEAFWDCPKYNVDSIDNEDVPDALEKAVQMLCAFKRDFDNMFQKEKMKVPSEAYRQWVNYVVLAENKVKELILEDTRRNKEEMKKMYKGIVNLLKQMHPIKDMMFVDRLPDPVVKRKGPDIKKFPSLQKHVEEILCSLRSGMIKGIRIQGIVGIGKTTIMLNLNNHEEVAKIFDIVIWLTVSEEGSNRNLSIEHLQQAIMQRLKVRIESIGNGTNEVAQRISMELKDKKYLLLLDDVKEDLDFEKIGIPNGKDGSNIVLTTRYHHICPSRMKQVIKVTCLTPNEAWKMFLGVLGKPDIENPKVRRAAWRVCKECNGLPLVIEKIAKIFRLKTSERLWMDGLDSWRLWPEKDQEGIREMYKLLKFCYDDLDDPHRQKCFLYCALYPENEEICMDRLLECWAAEELLNNGQFTTDMQVIMSGDSILSHLKNVSLLEEGQVENHVKMHKFMRQVALFISEIDDECKHMVRTSNALQKPPDVNFWSEMIRISLGDNNLDQLPNSPKCAMLSTLFLQKNLNLKEIPRLFFEHMGNLKVLDLSHTGIKLLPKSMSTLSNLIILYLNNCEHLTKLPLHITKLGKLEALDIQGSGINNIPPHVEKLICLRRLRVSFKSRNPNASHEVDFNHRIISKLCKLEELVIEVKSPEQWSHDVQENVIKQAAKLEELQALWFYFPNETANIIEVAKSSRGTCVGLHARICEATMINSFLEDNQLLNLKRIESFLLFIGCKDSEYKKFSKFDRYVKYVKYCNGTGRDFLIGKLLPECEAFELVNHSDITKLSDIEVANLKGVKGCLISGCPEIENIVGATNDEVLPKIEYLHLDNLMKMKQIWPPSMQPASCPNLETLVLTHCPMLVNIFPTGFIQRICRIKCLKIQQCEGVKEILESDNVGNSGELPKLEKLTLLQMPNLERVSANQLLAWPSLEKLKIYNCEKLCKLPFNNNNAMKLRSIKVEQQWWDGVQCQNEEVKEHLRQFCTYRS